MTVFEKLSVRIKRDLNIELGEFERCRPGYWQRSAGAWSWRSRRIDTPSPYDYGSSWSATDLLKEKEPLMISGTEIIPST